MTIRKKTLLAVGLTFLVLLMILTINLRLVVFNGFLQLESDNVRLNVERGSNTLAEMLANLDATAQDWASWNDTYEFLKNRNARYIENNLMDETLLTLKVNFMLFFDADQRPAVGRHADLVNKTGSPVPDVLMKAVISAMAAANRGDARVQKKGILMLGGLPALVVSRPILKSDDTGPARGMLFIGKYLDQNEIRRISEMMRLPHAICPVREAQRLFSSHEFQSLIDGRIMQQARDNQFIAGYTVVKDLYGDPAFILKAELPRNIFQHGQKVWYFSIISLVTTCLVFSLMIVLFLEKSVLKPLNGLSRRVSGIGEKYDPFIPIPVARKDELGILAEKINHMLNQINEKTTQLEQANAILKQDIADRIIAGHALKESEKRYRSILDAVPNAISISGLKDGRFKEVNDAFTRTTGFTRDEVIGKTLIGLNANVERENCCSVTATVKKCSQINGMSLQFRRKDGRVMDAILAARQMQYNGEECVVASIVDDTVRKQTEMEKNKLVLQLQQSQKMESIGTLAGGIAHDFNNILSSIMGYSELALDCVEKESVLYPYLKAVLAAGDRAKDLVGQILTFARQADAEEKPVRVKYLVNESLKLIRASIPSTISINKNLQSDSLILANPTQIHQVIMNLCTNAAQAMEEQGGTLEVDLKDVAPDENFSKPRSDISPGKYLLLSVRDTGNGIRPDITEKIFDPYFTTKAKGEGTGLGLSVVKGIVDGCNGFIGVSSEMGKGTEFNIYFPVLEFEATEPAAPVERQRLRGGNERILFIDDEPLIAELGEQMLSILGYRVAVRSSSIEALELFKADPSRFDLVISDITMPHMTGDFLAVEILKIRPDLPVILCTGYSKRISDEKAAEIGVKAILFKPIVKSQLAETIRKVLDKPTEQNTKSG